MGLHSTPWKHGSRTPLFVEENCQNQEAVFHFHVSDLEGHQQFSSGFWRAKATWPSSAVSDYIIYTFLNTTPTCNSWNVSWRSSIQAGLRDGNVAGSRLNLSMTLNLILLCACVLPIQSWKWTFWPLGRLVSSTNKEVVHLLNCCRGSN